ncbi:MAG: glycerol-3-phosphate 1-O-acyltransferase PlsY [Pyrinomonadaceae bacterium]
MRHAFILIAAYLLGSIPSGFLIVRLTRRADVRETGSGGTGATNVTRRAGKLAGILTLALDAAKGAAAILLARWLLAASVVDFNGAWWIAAAAVAAIIGHVFPMWLGFRGGKGVATGLGVFLCLAPLAVVLAALVFICVVWTTRYVSLGSICAVAALPVCIAIIAGARLPLSMEFAPLMMAAIACGALIVFMHRENIRRLRSGTENKFR